MALISELITKLKLDDSEFGKGLQGAISGVENFASKAKVGIIAVAAIIATGLIGAFVKLGSIISENTQKISNLADASNRLGISVGALQSLQYAAKQSGVSVDTLNSSMKFLMKNISAAANGNGKLKEAFSQLQLDPKQLMSMSADKQFTAVADAIRAIPNATEQTALAMQILGRSGSEALSLIKEDIGGLMKEFESFGGKLTDEQAKAVESYGDSLGRLQTVIEAFGLQLTAAVAGPLESVVNWIVQFIKESGGMGRVAHMAARFVVAGIHVMVQAVQELINMPDKVIIAFSRMGQIILRISQFATLGLSNIIAGAGDKISELQDAIDNSRARLANPITGGLQDQLQKARDKLAGRGVQSEGPSANPLNADDFKNWKLGEGIEQQTVNVKVQVDTSPELVANVVNSDQNKAVISKTTSNMMSSASRGGLQ